MAAIGHPLFQRNVHYLLITLGDESRRGDEEEDADAGVGRRNDSSGAWQAHAVWLCRSLQVERGEDFSRYRPIGRVRKPRLPTGFRGNDRIVGDVDVLRTNFRAARWLMNSASDLKLKQ
jgi:hypothetical protein